MAWERLDHVELGSNGTLASGTFSAKKNLRVIIYGNAVSGGTLALNFNSDTGNNYPYRTSDNGGSDGTAGSQPAIPITITSNVKSYCVIDITNISDEEKLIIGHTIDVGSGSGAGNAPVRKEFVAKWANTSAQITSIQIVNNSAASLTLEAGSYITVLGAKEAATADTLSVTGMEARKHLMIQIKNITTGGAVSQRLTFNNDTGNNYAVRNSFDGGSDNTQTSGANINAGHNDDLVTDSVGFTTTYVINEASKEKLAISESVSGESAGAGNAPTRDECVFKWANTSNQITRVDITNNKAGSYAEGTEITVYGTD